MLSTVVESKKKWDTKKADKMETDRSTMSQQKRSHVRKTEDSTTWCTDIRKYTWSLTKSEQYARNAWPNWRPGVFWEAGAFWFDAAGEFECVTWKGWGNSWGWNISVRSWTSEACAGSSVPEGRIWWNQIFLSTVIKMKSMSRREKSEFDHTPLRQFDKWVFKICLNGSRTPPLPF